MRGQGFSGTLDDAAVAELEGRARRCRGAVLTATTLAASGHPGGSFSSMETYLTLYRFANVRPDDPAWPGRDRVVVSHGHTSPGVYMALADAGFFPIEEAVAHFRQAGSPFEGHVERDVPGVEWSTGNLGQGLSAGVGFALAARMTGRDWHTFVAMSDGEQMKGQVAEARRLAVGSGLSGLTVVVDLNGIQITGHTADIMPVRVADDFRADGWDVVECDGHDFRALHAAIAQAVASPVPTAVLARTVMMKGVPAMEDDPAFHGRGLTTEEYVEAMAVLGLEPDLEAARMRRSAPVPVLRPAANASKPPLVVRPARTYAAGESADDRSAWGRALLDIAEANPDAPIAVLDCDLAESVKTAAFRERFPERFVECGVGEHNAAAVAGALSVSGVHAFWADFGVFGIDEPYNQQRLNDINRAELRLVVTHCGLDVGEDGRTHHCLDYVGALRDFFGWRAIVPADANQTDRAVRAMVAMEGNVALCMGRSKLPVILAADGTPFFGGAYEFRYGAVDWVREGADACLLVMGTVSAAGVRAADSLAADGLRVAVGVATSPLHIAEEDLRRAASAPLLVTAEDHGVRTGLGASVAEGLALGGHATRFARLGVTGYRTSGKAGDLLAAEGLDAVGIEGALRRLLGT